MKTQHHNTSNNHNPSTYLVKPHICRNCGYQGHLYRECPHPITSFGIICYRKTPINTIEYLLIQRKDSLCFMEFIRGKYDIKNTKYIKELLSRMTSTEHNSMFTMSFEDLWNYIWYQPYIQKQTSEFNHAKLKFTSLKDGVEIDNEFISLQNLIDDCNSIYNEPEWGFPKGRRRIREADVQCAVREFNEETGIGHREITLQENMPPYEEIFFGTNNILYRHVYYVSKMNYTDSNTIDVNLSNINQVREVRAIKWLSYEDVLKRIRDYNTERKNIFKDVHRKINDFELKSK